MASTGTGTRLSELERTWFADRVGSGSSIQKINELKQVYYSAQLSGASGTISELESQWLRKYISDQGDTPSDTSRLSTLWREAVVAAGLTPANGIEQNKWIFYSNVTA